MKNGAQEGFTLVELLVTMGLLAAVSAVGAGLFGIAWAGWVKNQHQNLLRLSAMRGMASLGEDLREAGWIEAPDPARELRLFGRRGPGGYALQAAYTWDPERRVLERNGRTVARYVERLEVMERPGLVWVRLGLELGRETYDAGGWFCMRGFAPAGGG